ncbi:HAD family hydrolase [Ktedonospora formicarum]|uniref:Phosphoserine phosphatase n=1 Tax=Ktedonospora formicarum TaxID=2778364 RepID=A0A8J3MV89_9CHLR|nr:HAD family hydrolase [Ktedonospora formicarum]GHO50052.1 putative uncharacterized hydrolase YsaA [Ktedonospora formicarum]
MQIKTIIFDLDETLIEDRDATHSAFENACAFAYEYAQVDCERLKGSAYRHARRLWAEAPTYDYCREIGISASEGMWGRFEGDGSDLQALYEWAPVYQERLWEYALAEQGIEDESLVKQLAAIFRKERRRSYRVFADVEVALSRLKQQYTLALLTNGAPDLQREKIRASGLESYFDAIVVSGEFGIGKPRPEVFSHVLEQVQGVPDETIMVGDSLPRDIVGAYRSGMRGIWLNRFGDDCIDACRPMIGAQICLLDELDAVISA